MFPSWQAPPVPVPYGNRPPCWGKSYNENDKECRGCGFQNSCKDQILRDNATRPGPTYGQPDPYRPYVPPAPIPVPVAPWHPQAPPQRFPLPVVAPQVPVARPPEGMVHQPPSMPPYGYGWVQDPIFHAVHAAPPLMRPQMQGEHFMERVVKNAALSMLEAFMGELFLAVRQMIWAPEKKVIDVTPRAPTEVRPPQ